MELPADFTLAAILKRDDPRDAFVSSAFTDLQSLPPGARIGTSSLRRGTQLQSQFPSLKVLPLRGNVNTRLAKLDRGEYDAIVLAAAGLKRLGMADRIRQILPPELSLPAAGQGALAIETLSQQTDIGRWMNVLEHQPTSWACQAERTVSRLLGGNCRAPLAAYCSIQDQTMSLRAMVGSLDGTKVLHASAASIINDAPAAVELGSRVARQLIDQGALALLAELGT